MTIKDALENMSIFIGSQGMKPESKQALFYLNRARRLVYPLDDWVHTIKYTCVPVCDCCFVLPEDCAAIRAAWDGNNNVITTNEYFDAVDKDFVLRNSGCKVRVFRTGLSLALPIQPNGSELFFLANNMDDAGKFVRISYKDTMNSLSSEKIELLDDFQLTGTSYRIKEVTAISKDRTDGPVSILLSTGKEIYSMPPLFTSGRFEQYKIDGQITSPYLLLKCKLRFRDYTTEDYDSLIDITSIDALEFAAKAMYAKSQSNISGYQQNILLARTHLEVAKEDLESSNRGYVEMRLPSNSQRDEHGRYG